MIHWEENILSDGTVVYIARDSDVGNARLSEASDNGALAGTERGSVGRRIGQDDSGIGDSAERRRGAHVGRRLRRDRRHRSASSSSSTTTTTTGARRVAARRERGNDERDGGQRGDERVRRAAHHHPGGARDCRRVGAERRERAARHRRPVRAVPTPAAAQLGDRSRRGREAIRRHVRVLQHETRAVGRAGPTLQAHTAQRTQETSHVHPLVQVVLPSEQRQHSLISHQHVRKPVFLLVVVADLELVLGARRVKRAALSERALEAAGGGVAALAALAGAARDEHRLVHLVLGEVDEELGGVLPVRERVLPRLVVALRRVRHFPQQRHDLLLQRRAPCTHEYYYYVSIYLYTSYVALYLSRAHLTLFLTYTSHIRHKCYSKQIRTGCQQV